MYATAIAASSMEYSSESTTPPRGRSSKRRSPTQDISERRAKRPKAFGNVYDVQMATPPTFQAPTPSRSRSRSQSPARKIINLLRTSIPSVQVEAETAIPGNAPVTKLWRELTVALKKPYVTQRIYDELDMVERSKLVCDAPGDVAFGDITEDELLRDMDKLLLEAGRSDKYHQDEASWMNIVRDVLLMLSRVRAARSTTKGEFQVVDIRSQTHKVEYLPQYTDKVPHFTKMFDKRTDFALAFDIESPRVQAMQQSCRISGSHDALPLSHMNDSFTQTLPLFAPIEVKRQGGSSEDAEVQLAVWQASAIRHKLGFLTGDVFCMDQIDNGLAPQISWTIIGHDWTPYLSWYDFDDGMHMIPITGLRLGTRNRATLLGLVAVFEEVWRWATDVHWKDFDGLMVRHQDRLTDGRRPQVSRVERSRA
ncbi:hypothetical protein KVT40_009231 [Elsinoe batatas]|uniref:PD-(D/E)XK nuclease-like domain-containing protein n=1 Tax=Elsinoe batatas TaxID=2601811 RepID=A0A8K0KUC7_9PEZI|nr:hypothetical protein KVT40_009231 [Elsinoe batatas]